jgi:large subunit ribosomal protein L15
MIDTKVVDPSEPIDMATICGTNQYKLDPLDNCYGVHLTDDGIDQFRAKVNIEVQHASEQVIAAIERNGGIISTTYYDISSVIALCNPKRFFEKGSTFSVNLTFCLGSNINNRTILGI